MKGIELLVVIPLGEDALARLRRECHLHYAPDGPRDEALARVAGRGIRAVLTNGSTGFSAAQMGKLPALELVCCYGAGYENVDRAAARARRIAVTHAPGVNDATVADHALALMLAAARGIAGLDRAVRAGKWASSRAERPTLSGARLGLLGLGNIGAKIAQRAAAFDMTLGYHARRARPDAPWRHYASLVELVRESDFLVVACPGGPATHHLVNRPVLDALGPQGILVNIARGSVVDTSALVESLRTRRIAAAALDVIEGEPEVPAELLQLDNVVFTPHVAGRSPAAVRAQTEALLANLAAHCADRPLPSAVPADG
jgi:D-3-phosphoglycerate dehydrogenase